MLSVCMATFNGGCYIEEQLKSILEQLDDNDEVIISDGGSSDDTLELISEINDSRVKVVTYDGVGVIGNFENAMSVAQGECIFLADQDDVWLPGRVSAMVSALGSNILVMANSAYVDAKLTATGLTAFGDTLPVLSFRNIFIRNRFIGCHMAFRRELVDAMLPFPKKIPMHDSYIAGVLWFSRRSVAVINDSLMLYRRHDANASSTGARSTRSIITQLLDRFFLMTAVVGGGMRFIKNVRKLTDKCENDSK